ncbi:MAG: hypothetical protein HVN35_10075 [Methanobacteriaceae archaeon]|nr:hypothetical protein [Methanobacteriaceae archaeon]
MDLTFLFVQRGVGFTLGLLLFYTTLKLLNALKNKEIAMSMVFLHKKRVINLFGLLVMSTLITFITGLVYVFLGNSIIVELLLDLNALILLMFTFFLQKLMRGV